MGRLFRAGIILTGLLGSTLVVAPPASADPGDPVVVLNTDFEDGTWDPWTQNGDPTLSVVETDGDQALLIADRANDYDGIKSPGNLLVPGEQYTFSMQARLADGTEGSAGIRFVVEPAYSWVGNTSMTAAAWTTVSGTYTAPADADPAGLRVYIGTDNLSAPYDYLVDDIVFTGTEGSEDPWEPTPDPDFVPGGAVDPTETPIAEARGTGDVAALTFDDGPNPGETDRLLDYLADNDLQATFCVIGQNIEAPGGTEILNRIVDDGHTLCNHSTSYADMGGWTHEQVETDLKANLAIIRDALGDPNQPVPYFRAPNGSWGVTGEVAAALGMQPLGLGNVIFDWETQDLATLTENLRDAIVPGAVVLVHDGGGDRENSVNAVETVVSERLADGWTFTLPEGGIPDGSDGREDIATDFEDGTTQGWAPRGDGVVVEATTTDAAQGDVSLLTTNRTQNWHGPSLDVTRGVAVGVAVEISLSVKLAPGEEPATVQTTIQRTSGDSVSYEQVAGASGLVTADEWVRLTGTYTMGAPADEAILYVESPSLTSFLIDDFSLVGITETPIQDIPPLKDVLAPYFEHVGVAIDTRETAGRASELLLKHYNAISPENDAKPESVQPVEGQFNFTNLDALLDFADANGIQVYGHVLVWHSQTPAWFFEHEDGTPLTDSPEDQELLLSRMEAHIKGISDHINARYPDGNSPIWAWDVVNEVIEDGFNDNPYNMRDSRWFQVLGKDFVAHAFRFAHEYFPDAALFINDYNTEFPNKRANYFGLISELVETGVPIDGVGHQAHVNIDRPIVWMNDSIELFETLPLLQAITELDVSLSRTPDEYQPAPDEDRVLEAGYYYRDFFDMLRTHADALESVTIWGLYDSRSWLRTWPQARPQESPLPFDDDLQANPAYWGIVDPSKLAEPRPTDDRAPLIVDHRDITVPATSSSGALVEYETPEAADARDGYVAVECTPRSGSIFPVGATTVICRASDSVGNQTTSSFQVTVEPPAGTEADVSVDVTGPAKVRPGQRVTYTLVVTNNGAITAEDLTASLTTLGLRNVTASEGAIVDARTNLWQLPELAPGESVELTVTGRVRQQAPATGVLGTATAATPDPALDNNTDRLRSRVR